MNKDNRRELINSFIKEMRKLGYQDWYIGKQVAHLIWALELP